MLKNSLGLAKASAALLNVKHYSFIADDLTV
jgi:hypothetical protein